MSLTDLFLRATYFGAEWVLWVLVMLSLVSVTIIVERTLFFYLRRVNVDQLAAEIKAALIAGSVDDALRLVQGSKAIECMVHGGRTARAAPRHPRGERDDA